MKKIILLSLITIGIGVAGATAQAGGLGVGISVGPVRLPLLPPLPALPIFAPPAVVVGGGCASPVVVSDCHPDFRYRVDVRRDFGRHFDYRHDARFHGRR